ncbi:MAG: hypothetical protein OJF50_001512 [Nitrospira sp.]|nr:hypothetical protein [Nitrospira sp.]
MIHAHFDGLISKAFRLSSQISSVTILPILLQQLLPCFFTHVVPTRVPIAYVFSMAAVQLSHGLL